MIIIIDTTFFCIDDVVKGANLPGDSVKGDFFLLDAQNNVLNVDRQDYCMQQYSQDATP